MEVLAERVVQVAQQLLQSTAELKRRAFLAHAGARLATPESSADNPAPDVEECLGQLKAEVDRRLQVDVPRMACVFAVSVYGFTR